MKNSNKMRGLVSSAIAIVFAIILLFAYDFGIISEELFLRLISVENPAVTETGDYDLSVHFIDVSQAECVLIKALEKTVLIDAGDIGFGNEIENYLRTNGVDSIDIFITTHPHADHIGSADYILEKFPVGEVIMPEIPEKYIPTTAVYENMLYAIAGNGCEASLAENGEVHDLGGGASIRIFVPEGNFGDNLNNYSLVTKLSFGDTEFLFTGDIEEEAELALIDSGADLSADVFDACHHGSSSSNSVAFLREVSPEYAAISCGYDNDYGHPHREVISRFGEMGIEYYRTDLEGDIIFLSDGNDILVRTKK